MTDTVTSPREVLHLEHLSLTDLRNHPSFEATFPPGLTVITGANGQGKTAVLEAVGFLATGRSFRGAPPETLVRLGAQTAVIRGTGFRAGRRFQVEAELRPGGRTRLQRNGQRVSRARDLHEALLVSVFTPDDLALVKGPPAGRREWLDDVVVACAPTLAGVRTDVERVLRQKGALLRQVRGRPDSSAEATLAVWNQHLTTAGERLGLARARCLERLGPMVSQAYATIAERGSDGIVVLRHLAPWRVTGLAEALASVWDEELRRGTCLVGPQRDDVALDLADLPARSHASQGEQRSLALALRLGAHRLVTETVGVAPVLLLDDLFSELDPGRSASLLSHLPTGQAILTTAGGLPEGAHPDIVLTLGSRHP